jgi:hypothetical protein
MKSSFEKKRGEKSNKLKRIGLVIRALNNQIAIKEQPG